MLVGGEHKMHMHTEMLMMIAAESLELGGTLQSLGVQRGPKTVWKRGVPFVCCLMTTDVPFCLHRSPIKHPSLTLYVCVLVSEVLAPASGPHLVSILRRVAVMISGGNAIIQSAYTMVMPKIRHIAIDIFASLILLFGIDLYKLHLYCNFTCSLI